MDNIDINYRNKGAHTASFSRRQDLPGGKVIRKVRRAPRRVTGPINLGLRSRVTSITIIVDGIGYFARVKDQFGRLSPSPSNNCFSSVLCTFLGRVIWGHMDLDCRQWDLKEENVI